MPKQVTSEEVREALVERREIALLDVREEGPHASGHPLFAANMPLGRMELEAYTRLPRRSVAIVLLDDGEGLVEKAAKMLDALGYTNVSLLAGGLQRWRDAGYEIFIDVNAPSKAFGELVEAERGTPSLSAEEVQARIRQRSNHVILDARRFDEYQTMNIPTSVSVPGAELALRVRSLAPNPETEVIVNCAGRTRSIIGAQSLINLGIPNRVSALRNGAIGWQLAQQELSRGAAATFAPTSEQNRAEAEENASKVARRARVRNAALADLDPWQSERDRTTYCFDVRTPSEYEAAHLPGFRSVPGGQLVQETEMFAPVRGARIVLADTDGVRARMTGSWLSQMGWEVYVLSRVPEKALTECGVFLAELPSLPEVPSASRISFDLFPVAALVLDFTPAIAFRRSHLPGSLWASRDHLDDVVRNTGSAQTLVVTAADEALAHFSWRDLQARTGRPVLLLDRSSVLPNVWSADDPLYACAVQDRYMRPYEGTSASRDAMQSYLDWEAGLVAQLRRDGTHHFFVI